LLKIKAAQQVERDKIYKWKYSKEYQKSEINYNQKDKVVDSVEMQIQVVIITTIILVTL